MYYYIVDPQKISQREFERVQNLLYSSLSEYRISGEIMRVTGVRTINQLVETAFAHEAKTIVAVGSDDTLHDVINAIRGREVVVGFMPIFDTKMSEVLGISGIEQAAKTVAQRRVAELDLGVANNNYFLHELSFGLAIREQKSRWNFMNFSFVQMLLKLPMFEVKLSANQEFTASVKVIGGIIANSLTNGSLDIKLLPQLSLSQILRSSKQIFNGNFENIPQASLVHAQKLEITAPPGLSLRVGNRVIAKTPAQIEILPKALKIIVGKDRKF